MAMKRRGGKREEWVALFDSLRGLGKKKGEKRKRDPRSLTLYDALSAPSESGVSCSFGGGKKSEKGGWVTLNGREKGGRAS